MQFRVGAVVNTAEGEVGKLDALIVDPTTASVTHLVVSSDRLLPRKLVPVPHVTDATPDTVTITDSRDDFEQLEAFDEPDYNLPEEPGSLGELQLDPGFYFLEPYATPMDGWLLAGHERVPKDEIAIRRGSEVVSKDGTHVGHVDEFLVDPGDGHVTHVVLRQGHVFKREDVVIPVHAATRFDDDRVKVDLTVTEIAELPHIPVKRHRHVSDAT